MRKLEKQIAAVTGTTAAVAGFTLAMSAPARATAWDCQAYLSGLGYVVGPNVTNACATGAEEETWAEANCRIGLIYNQVAQEHAIEACVRTAW